LNSNIAPCNSADKVGERMLLHQAYGWNIKRTVRRHGSLTWSKQLRIPCFLKLLPLFRQQSFSYEHYQPPCTARYLNHIFKIERSLFSFTMIIFIYLFHFNRTSCSITTNDRRSQQLPLFFFSFYFLIPQVSITVVFFPCLLCNYE